MLRSLTVSSLAFLIAVVPSAASTDETDAVTAVLAFHEALGAQDSDAVLALLDSAVIIFESGGAELSRDEYASHHLGSDMQFAAATENRIVDQQSGVSGDMAWILTRSETTGTFRERAIDSSGTETMVLRHTESGWKIVHIHWSSRARGKAH